MKLYIFGAGHGTAEILEDSDFYRDGFKINTFEIESIKLVEDKPRSEEIVPTLSMYTMTHHDFVFGVISAWSPIWKKNLDKYRIQWVSAISPSSKIMLKKIPVGLNARHNSTVSISAKVGRHVRLNFNSAVTCDAEVGDYCFLAVGASMLGNSKLGKGSILYSHAVILPDVSVGANTIIGAGSVVTRDIPDNVIAYGNPCKVIRPNTDNIMEGHAVKEND